MGIIKDTYKKMYLYADGSPVGKFELKEHKLIDVVDELVEKKVVQLCGLDYKEIDIYMANYILESLEKKDYRFNEKVNTLELLSDPYVKIRFLNKRESSIIERGRAIC